MAAGSLASWRVLVLVSFSFSLLTVLSVRQYLAPRLAEIGFYVGGEPVGVQASLDMLGYTLGFVAPAYAAVSVYVLWGGRRGMVYALYYYGRLYPLRVAWYLAAYSAGLVLVVGLYLVSALGEVSRAILVAAAFAAELGFFAILYSAVTVASDAYPVAVLALVMARFFAVPQESLWFSSLPLAASYVAMGKLGFVGLAGLAVAYYALALLAYRWGARG